jgi:hypothetical protein
MNSFLVILFFGLVLVPNPFFPYFIHVFVFGSRCSRHFGSLLCTFGSLNVE